MAGREARSPSRRGVKRRSFAAVAYGALAASVCGLSAHVSHAYESEVEASVDAQFYTFQSPYGEPVLRRRRYVETLALSLYDLHGDAGRGGPSLDFRTRLRLDADLGQDPAERDPNSPRFVPGLSQAPLDLMYAYLDGRNYFGGLFAFRVGRQYVSDVLGFWSFDGGLVRLGQYSLISLEAYAGFEQRSGLPLLGTPRYQADGVARGSREQLRDDQWTSYLEQSELAPAFGVALESQPFSFLHARVAYRRVNQTDRVVVSPFADEDGALRYYGENRVSSERAGASLRLEDFDLGAVLASGVYDLYLMRPSEYALTLDVYASERLTLGLEHEYYLPTFDADSIFNFFTHSAQTTERARASFVFSRRFDVAGGTGIRSFSTEGDPESYAATGDRGTSPLAHDLFATLGGRYRFNTGSTRLELLADGGAYGHRVGGDLTTRKTFAAGYYDTLVVLSLYDWKDGLRPDRAATSFAYVLGAGVHPGLDMLNQGRIGVEFEHAMNRLVGQRYRVLATLDFSVLR
jgi:hypothetical protein